MEKIVLNINVEFLMDLIPGINPEVARLKVEELTEKARKNQQSS